MVGHRFFRAGLLVLLVAAVLPAAGCGHQSVEPGGLTFELGMQETFYPWHATVQLDSLTAQPGDEWRAAFEVSVDFRKLREFPEVVEGLVVALVGEQVFDTAGDTTGLTAISISPRFTTAGIPIAYYEGTLPVRALGNRRGSPFEAVAEFPAGKWARGGRHTFRGHLTVQLPEDIPPGYYRPHFELFVRFKDSATPIDLRHLPVQLGQWYQANIETAGPRHAHRAMLGKMPPDITEFMQQPQVLPSVKVGTPATPRLAWTVFHDVSELGQSGILANEDRGRLGLLTRVRLPTPLTLSPRGYRVNPGIPALFPESGLADVFIGAGTVPSDIKHFFDFDAKHQTGDRASFAQAVLHGPDGRSTDLGKKQFAGLAENGPKLEGGGFELDLTQTGDYRLTLTGEITDRFGRTFRGGGEYPFTVALPLSFSTPVKPGTNYLAGARFPAAAHINPPMSAEVEIDVSYFPNSDPTRRRRAVFAGRANRFGRFVPAGQAPLVFDEPGEYVSVTRARYVDERGLLWQGAQTSAGVIAQREPEIVLHGGRTYLAPPRPDLPNYGGLERYDSQTEGASSFTFLKFLTQYDFVLPYFSGDTLFVATTYPYETVVGIVLSMEAKTKALAQRLAEAYNPAGRPLNFPLVSRWHKPSLLPDLFKISEDNFGYHRISAEHADQLPVLSANRRGLSPLQYPQDNEIEAYAYLSVIRPGFSVLTQAFSGSFMGPCWIISPNPYGDQINTSPNGDLPGDLYRVMAGLVVKDKKTGRNYYDAYASTIIASPPGEYANAVVAPGERPLMRLNGRELRYFIGMDTSESFLVGERMMLGGTVMPPVETNVTYTVTKPDGAREVLAGRSNRLGGFGAPRPVEIDQPGVYRVKAEIERDGVRGDVAGTGDGEFYNFGVPADSPPYLQVSLPVISRLEPGGEMVIPLSWPAELTDARITYSLMMPGTVLDEGQRRVDGHGFAFRLDPKQFAVQYPFIDTVDYATGRPLYADTIVAVFFLEADLAGERVYDVARVILRGEMLFHSRPDPEHAKMDGLLMPPMDRRDGPPPPAPPPPAL